MTALDNRISQLKAEAVVLLDDMIPGRQADTLRLVEILITAAVLKFAALQHDAAQHVSTSQNP